MRAAVTKLGLVNTRLKLVERWKEIGPNNEPAVPVRVAHNNKDVQALVTQSNREPQQWDDYRLELILRSL